MKTRSAITFGPLTLGLSAMVLCGAAAGVSGGMAVAGAREQSRAEKHAVVEAGAAQKWLGSGRADLAIPHAEAAVADQPQVAQYRMLLGQSYLKSGRFASARDAFSDALTLDERDGRAALHFALAQIATGDWAGARKTVDAHADTIGIADRGLAIALAGDPAAAVELLAPAARTPEADAKLRQNLALSLALAGRWAEARTIVAMDVPADQVDRRIVEWAAFARPKSASDQVASLLGVTPAADSGLPAALALNGAARAGTPAVAAADPIDAYMPGKPAEAPAVAQAAPEPMPVPAATAEAAPAEVATVSGRPKIVFAERHEVVQPLPAGYFEARVARPVTVARAARVRLPVAAPRALHQLATGNFVVQLGAYENAGVARDAWKRAGRSFAGFSGRTPQGGSVTTKGGTFYRLSVGGFARGDAVSMCSAYRARGGKCFVRAGAGDQIAMWARGRELASR